MERVEDRVGVRELLGGIGQQGQQRRLVSDERAHPPRITGDQRQPRHRPAAGPEQVH